MLAPEQALKQYWGFDTFLPFQKDIISSVLAGMDTMAILPTGAGKSLCYQVPSVCSVGFTLVISPLIALMQDQVARLNQAGIMAACIHSGMHYTEVRRTMDNMLHGPYKLLYVSPERLQTTLFNEYLPEFNIGLVAVDEAHCISQWGYDFRPAYLKIADLRAVLANVPFIALTASATQEVMADISSKLLLNAPAVYRQSIARGNIYYTIKYSEQKIADTTAALPDTGNSIIYCRSRKQTEVLARNLQQAGRQAGAYHAGLGRGKRNAAQQAWMDGTVPVMAATTAFGMGIDKSNVRAVIHYDAPEHLEGYYQEAGRAGRDGYAASALLLYNSTDIKKLEESIALHFPPDAYLRQVYQAVAEYLQVPISAQPDRYYAFDLEEFCKNFNLNTISAAPALRLLGQEGLWTISETVFNPATLLFTADRHVLDDLSNLNPGLHYVCTGLLRLYGTLFHYPTPVRLTAVAKQLKLKKEEVEQAVLQMQHMQLLEYYKSEDGAQLFFHHYRVDSRHLLIDHKRIAALRKRHEERTNAMVSFLKNETECRELLLKKYFNEPPTAPCGHCDVCRKKQNTAQVSVKELRTQVVDKLYTSHYTMKLLSAQFPVELRELLIDLVREMANNGLLSISETGSIRLNKQ